MVSRFKKLWNGQQGFQGAAALLVATMLLSNILGFFRDQVLANTIPLRILDTYYAAFRLPDLLFNLFILGAISSAFIPVYLDLKTKENDKAAWQLVHNLMHTALIALAILGVIIYFAMPWILSHFLSGFSQAKISQTVPLARIMLLSPFLFAISYILGAVLNANKKFFAYALAPLAYNFAIIIGGLLVPFFGVKGVAWSVVVGALAHMLVQLPALMSLGYRYRFVFAPRDSQLWRVLKLMLPRAISLGMFQIVLLAFTRIGSFLPSGTVSIFNLTNNVQTTPVAIFAASIGTAVFPMLGAAASANNDKQYRSLLTQSLKGMFFFMLPSMVLLWVFRAHIIRLYLALNHQTWADTIRAIDTFSWFILALASQGLNLILIRAFYAKQDTARPMVVSIIGGALAIGLAFVFSSTIVQDVPALSLAFAVATITESIILLLVFLWYYPRLLDVTSLLNTIVVAGLFSLAAGALARLTLSIVSEGLLIPSAGLGTSHVLPLFWALCSAAVVGGVVYFGLAYLFKRPELLWILPKRAIRSIPVETTEEVAHGEGLV